MSGDAALSFTGLPPLLTQLRVRDYAVLDDVTLDLGRGLSALSGETGAGTSLIVGAPGLDESRGGAARVLIQGLY